MQFIVLFKDKPDAPADLRQKHMGDHLAFLSKHSDQITDAGPLFDGPTLSGGLWSVSAETVAQVEELIQADPFWTTGLRDTHEILEWHRVFAYGAVV